MFLANCFSLCAFWEGVRLSKIPIMCNLADVFHLNVNTCNPLSLAVTVWVDRTALPFSIKWRPQWATVSAHWFKQTNKNLQTCKQLIQWLPWRKKGGGTAWERAAFQCYAVCVSKREFAIQNLYHSHRALIYLSGVKGALIFPKCLG